MAPLYHRILLKLSGEALAGDEGGLGLAPEILERVATEIREIVECGDRKSVV